MVSSNISGGIRRQTSNLILNHENLESIHYSNLRRTQNKILPSAFSKILKELKDFVYATWNDEKYQYHGKNVIAIDGSKFHLPYSEELRKEYDIKSLCHSGNSSSYTPQCLVSTFYDVYRQIPVIRDVRNVNGSERAVVFENLKEIPSNSIIVADRNYYGYEIFHEIIDSNQDFLIRLPVKNGFNEVKKFAESTYSDCEVVVNRTKYTKLRSGKEKTHFKPVTIRLIKYTPKDGNEEIVLATSLLDREVYSTESLQQLYWSRWQVELSYRDEKNYVNSAELRSLSVNGVLQELYAASILRLVTNYEIYKRQINEKNKYRPQLLNAVTTVASALPKLMSLTKNKARQFLESVMKVVIQVRYYSQQRKQKYTRVSKKPVSKWSKKNNNKNGYQRNPKRNE